MRKSHIARGGGGTVVQQRRDSGTLQPKGTIEDEAVDFSITPDDNNASTVPAQKRRRFQAPKATPASSRPPFADLPVATQLQANAGSKDQTTSYWPVACFAVLYTKCAPQKKRSNKTFQDGVLEVKGDSCTLFDAEGTLLSKSVVKGCHGMPEGAVVDIGKWTCEVDRPMDAPPARGGRIILKDSGLGITPALPPAAERGVKPFRKPFAAALQQSAPQAIKRALHDPSVPGALILNQAQLDANSAAVPVVVDPYICRHLRPHQREGVQFLYNCTMGLREAGHHGCILADDMGLGKTLQVIALMWTLLRQGPLGREILKRVLVVMPASLMHNWAAEIRKWLGDERVSALVLLPGANAAQELLSFKHGAVHKVLITSYETLRKVATHLEGVADLMVCDEGHRLKAAAGNKTIDALAGLGCKRRILLTGTPLQNNLEELYAMVTFANPGILGSLGAFRREYAAPLQRANEHGALPGTQALGAERSAVLATRMAAFVLRRTAAVNAQYLPSLTSLVVFCPPSPLQVELYRAIIRSKCVASALDAGGGFVLSAITALRKLCTHPDLVLAQSDQDMPLEVNLPDDYEAGCARHSGKLACLEALLHGVVEGAGERMVVAASTTSALGLVERLCQARSWTTVRIDGGTDAAKRQDIVNAFNLHGVGQVFLLSSRAGGMGLNLVGANRLVLFESDWNPAVDLQVMARVWREGQKKPCWAYRLLMTGAGLVPLMRDTIDEKIYQRQLMKGKLADVVDVSGPGAGPGPSAGPAFTREELRDLFCMPCGGATCSTAAIMQRGGLKWQDAVGSVDDLPLREAAAAGLVSFVHEAKRTAHAPASNKVDHVSTALVDSTCIAAAPFAGRSAPTAAGCDDVACLEFDD